MRLVGDGGRIVYCNGLDDVEVAHEAGRISMYDPAVVEEASDDGVNVVRAVGSHGLYYCCPDFGGLG